MDQLIKQSIDKCLPCQGVGKENSPEPLRMTDMLKRPWYKLNIDFFGPIPSGESLLVVIDRYSRHPEVEIVKSTKASVVIPKLDKMFSVHGIPYDLTSDNSPPFNGDEFRRHLKLLGVKCDPSTPKWPQGNAEVERFMQSWNKALTTATIEGKKWQQVLTRFLLQYRTTPNSTTRVPPAALLLNRSVRGLLPQLQPHKIINRHKKAESNKLIRKNYNKQYADTQRHAKESHIKEGDTVLVRQEKKHKLMPKFNEKPYVVIERKGVTIITENEVKHRITRNISHFKKIPKQVQSVDSSDDDEPIVQAEPQRNQIYV
eukprot:gene12395-biopygen9880